MANKAQPEKRNATAKRIIKALQEAHGLTTVAAKKAGVTHQTLQRYIRDFPTVAEAKKESQETLLDFAESTLYQKIRDGETASLLFFLKCQGKARGYVERSEITGANGGPVEVTNARAKLIAKLSHYDVTEEAERVAANADRT